MNMNKQDMERIWRQRDMAHEGYIAAWTECGNSFASTPKHTVNNKNLREIAKYNGHYTSGRPMPATYKKLDIEPSAELKAKMRRECPNNAAALIAGYGKLDKWDSRGY